MNMTNLWLTQFEDWLKDSSFQWGRVRHHHVDWCERHWPYFPVVPISQSPSTWKSTIKINSFEFWQDFSKRCNKLQELRVPWGLFHLTSLCHRCANWGLKQRHSLPSKVRHWLKDRAQCTRPGFLHLRTPLWQASSWPNNSPVAQRSQGTEESLCLLSSLRKSEVQITSWLFLVLWLSSGPSADADSLCFFKKEPNLLKHKN